MTLNEEIMPEFLEWVEETLVRIFNFEELSDFDGFIRFYSDYY